jgi:hypothetical protein
VKNTTGLKASSLAWQNERRRRYSCSDFPLFFCFSFFYRSLPAKTTASLAPIYLANKTHTLTPPCGLASAATHFTANQKQLGKLRAWPGSTYHPIAQNEQPHCFSGAGGLREEYLDWPHGSGGFENGPKVFFACF